MSTIEVSILGYVEQKSEAGLSGKRRHRTSKGRSKQEPRPCGAGISRSRWEQEVRRAVWGEERLKTWIDSVHVSPGRKTATWWVNGVTDSR